MKRKLLFPVLLATAVLTGCGGGGGSGNTATTLTGTAATGAPFDGAAVSIIDKSGTVVGSGTTNADGSYAITLSAGAAAPFVVQAVRDDLTLVSVVPDASSSNVNITPITNLIASRLTASGDPARLAAELQANPDLLSPVKVSAKVDEIVALLKPLLDAVGTAVNPLTGEFSANGTGLDRALDSLSIKITPESATTANIEVAIKQKTADGEQPALVQFASSDTALPPAPAVTEASLVPSGTASLIADLMRRATACFALPVAQRVATPDAANAAPSDIIAPECKSMFLNNDPAAFLQDGQAIGGATRTKPFSGLFRAGATNAVFDRGTYEFTRPNNDQVIAYRITDSIGGSQNLGGVVRLSPTDNKLYFVGNQYQFPGGVSAYHQLRTYLNQPEATYYSTGYAFSVPALPALEKVVVTTPKGGVLTLVKTAGSSFMTLLKGGTPLATSYLRVRGEYVNRPLSDDPALADANNFFDPARPGNPVIAGYAQQSNWRFDYYLAAAPTVLHGTQYYKTRARAMTIPELKMQGIASLRSDVIADIRADSNPTNGTFPLNFTGPAILDWDVPSGALAPTTIRLFGKAGGQSFEDAVNVNSTMRQGSIFCAPQSETDAHCTASGSSFNFAAGSFATGLDLIANDPAGRNFSHFHATHKITLP